MDEVLVDPTTSTGAERKQVTVLFSDISGYTALAEKLDPEDTREIITEVFQRATEIIHKYEGQVEKFIGDAIMATFGIPTAHEDDPIRAVRAALEMHQLIMEMAPAIEVSSGVRVNFHTGINTGLVVTGELSIGGETAGPVGDTINLASRVMADAPAGEIWVSPSTMELSRSTFTFETVGSRQFKGKTDPVSISSVTGFSTSSSIIPSIRTSFVGRTNELDRFFNTLVLTREGSHCNIAFRAEAGCGKSRLFEEFQKKLPEDVQWLEGRAYQFATRIPYSPFIDLLNRAFTIKEDDDKPNIEKKLRLGISSLLSEPDRANAIESIGHLYNLSFSGEIQKVSFARNLLKAYSDLLANLSADKIVIVCLQDLHWADASSLAMLNELLAMHLQNVVFAVNFRPGLVLSPEHIDIVDLDVLQPEEIQQLVSSMLNGAELDQLAALVQERCEGNPFFAEEIVNSMIDTGALEKVGDEWTLTQSPQSVGVPNTVQGVLAARIDRLAHDKRRLLREASVIGREFMFELVSQISETSDEIKESLNGLVNLDLIRESDSREYLEFIFKHALTQEVAYEGLLKKERQAIHQKVGIAIENLLGHRLGEMVETLAYHYHRAGDVDKAAFYSIAAGKRAFDRSALAEAEIHFRSGFDLLDSITRTDHQNQLLVQLLVEWCDCLVYDLKVLEAGQMLDKYLQTAEELGDENLLMRYRALRITPYWANFEFEKSLDLCDQVLAIPNIALNHDAHAMALTWRGFNLAQIGRGSEAAEYCLRAVKETELAGEPGYLTRWLSSFNCVLRGEYGLLEEQLGHMQEQADAGLTRFYSYMATTRSLLAGSTGDFDRVLVEAELGLAQPHEPFEGSYLMGLRTFGHIILNNFDEALLSAREHSEYHKTRPTEYCESTIRTNLAGISISQGHLTKGIEGVIAGAEYQAQKNQRIMQVMMESSVIDLYIKLAANEFEQPPILALLRNPGFIIRHVIPAIRNAEYWLSRATADIEKYQMHGYKGAMAYHSARIALLTKDRDRASRELDQCIASLNAAGVTEVPERMVKLGTQIEEL